ncbi:hypothetical protein POL68_18720 [Stigmatella sp. ncwal1]|uniref:Uncharacterized protein n=1 Tax=Stigmatella ashevillensis TaxID=2995309 RepID=A0ABT5DA30_9BACT|nr:hypothetical protein [Stigmatella ashevillena]MDC0710517.1 hypothetical protein [Stigmatella ashevillena]
MSYDEAVSQGLQLCRSRGYECQLKDARRTSKDIWKVRIDAYTGNARGHVHADYHAYSRELLKVDERVRRRKGEWDDDGHGHVRKRGHARHDD